MNTNLPPIKGIVTSTKVKNRLKALNPNLVATVKNIRVNADTRGCSGFISNPATGRHVYIMTEESAYGPLKGKALYRTATDLKDFSGRGGRNHHGEMGRVVELAIALLEDPLPEHHSSSMASKNIYV